RGGPSFRRRRGGDVSLRFVLLGHPVAHSVSPAIHHAAYASLGVAHRYELVDAQNEGEVAAAVEELRRGEIAGANVTIPWKRVALKLADAADASASAVGAANVLLHVPGRGIVAYNTDVLALREELALLSAEPRSIVVIGSGGAALAAVASCQALGARVGVVARRFRAQGQPQVAGSDEFVALGATILPWPEGDPSAAFLKFVCGADIVVQATSAGMHGADSGETVADLVPWADVPAECAAYDLVYNPAETPFLQRARAAGHRAEGGLGMLVGQAHAALKLWLGVSVPREPLYRAASAALAARLS
ncbi:MAG TPA: shikimate dehydrogenase, partial [Polyangiaceae bacterium]|nr:shikimate dehydrogenase [Polyangiaceae bacterium]